MMEFPPRYTIALTQQEIDSNWPNLQLGANGQIDSLKDRPNKRYNCVAFALGEENVILDMGIFAKRIDLAPSGLSNASLDHTINGYIILFRHFYQFEVCESAEIEEGFNKIVLYEGIGEDGEVGFLHVALQLEDGTWKSKMGEYED